MKEISLDPYRVELDMTDIQFIVKFIASDYVKKDIDMDQQCCGMPAWQEIWYVMMAFLEAERALKQEE